MHVNRIIAGDKDIEFAEGILLNKGQIFDESRREYIRNFSTLDLMAVPGSGKTTLLLAKLLILEKNLPLPDNSAVLVISHTNIAVNEIQDKLKELCPGIFSYPNFIGTIQSFVNKYLALPFYERIYNKRIKSIDEEKYYNAVENYYNSTMNYNLKSWLNRKYEPIELLKRIRFNEKSNLVMDIDGKEEDFILKDKNSFSYKGLKQMKVMLLQSGILHYDDAYYLATQYINRNSRIIKLILKRFRYIFVDEMQDMDVHQYQLLEKIFVEDNIETTSFQRLGDNNQAIYNNMANSDAIWENRKKTHTINGSNRLTRLNAKLASRFSIDNLDIEGLNVINKEHKPVLIVYDKSKAKCFVIETFSNYLNDLFKTEFKCNNIVYKVVSWRRSHKDKDKTTLSSYCPNYMYMKEGENNSAASSTKNLDYYMVTKILIDKMVENLNEANIKIDDKDVRKSSLINYLKELGIEEYDKYKLCIYRCIRLLTNGEYKKFYKEFNDYLRDLGQLLNDCSDYNYLAVVQEDEFNFINELDDENKRCQKCNIMGNSPIINTVHSVKGETHDATLFLESFYNSKYECDLLHEVLCGKNISDLLQEHQNEINKLKDEIESIENKRKTVGIPTRENKIKSLKLKIRTKKQYAKIVYVALTRAKSVVGYGISRDRYNQYLAGNINMEEWEILFIE